MPGRLQSLRDAYERLGDPGGLRALAADVLAPDVELDFSALPDGAVMRGIDAFEEFRKDRPWVGQLTLEPEDFIEAGPDQVLVLVRVRTVAPSLDAGVEGQFAHLLTFRGDRIVRWQLFTDRTDARRAAGIADRSDP